MKNKKKRILIPYSIEYQIGPMEEPYIGTEYFDLTQYYKYTKKEKGTKCGEPTKLDIII